MTHSDYIQKYIDDAKKKSKNELLPNWLKKFFLTFHKELDGAAHKASGGDRYLITRAFSKSAIGTIFPKKIDSEFFIGRLLNEMEETPLKNLLSKKRVDFRLEGKDQDILIEFKTNIQFNDLAAAMVEMQTVKMFKPPTKKIVTASLHLFPSSTNVEGLMQLNEKLGKPLDHIWVLCNQDQEFDVKEIKKLRSILRE